MLHPPHDGYIDLVSCITTLFSMSQIITFITFLMIFLYKKYTYLGKKQLKSIQRENIPDILIFTQ